MTDKPSRLTHATGAPVSDNLNILTAGRRGPALLQDIWLIEKLAPFASEVIPERLCTPKGRCVHTSRSERCGVGSISEVQNIHQVRTMHHLSPLGERWEPAAPG